MIARILLCLFLLGLPAVAVAQDSSMYGREEMERIIAEQQRAFGQEMMRQQQQEAEAAKQNEATSHSPTPPRQTTIDSVAPQLPPALERRQKQMADLPRFSSVWIRQGKIGENTAAYMTIYGSGSASTIKSVSSPWAQRVELHTTTTDDKGVIHMQAVGDLPVAANSKTELAPGGMHVMFFGLRRDIRPGQVVPLTFTLEGGATARAVASVKANPAAAMAMPQHSPAMHQGH